MKAKCDITIVKRCLGTAKSKADTKAEEKKRAALEKLDTEWTKARQKLEADKKAALAKLEADFEKQINDLNSKMRAKRDALN